MPNKYTIYMVVLTSAKYVYNKRENNTQSLQYLAMKYKNVYM